MSALAGLTILVLGSSHHATPGYLITSLHDNLLSQGAAHVYTYGLCGGTPRAWLAPSNGKCGGAERVDNGPVKMSLGKSFQTRAIGDYVKDVKPDLVVIEINDTIADYKNDTFPREWQKDEVSKLAKALAQTGVKCAWVGPAWGQEKGSYGKNPARTVQVADFLASNVAPCSFIDSRKMSKESAPWPSTDGQHYTIPGYKSWADGIIKAVVALPGLKK